MSIVDDDVFTDSQVNTIVDADVIEAVKENIQPLQKGRRATALSAIFSTPHSQRDQILSRKRAQFRLQVVQALEDVEEDDETADPLDVYSRFVAWTLESYPQGQSADSGLLELLEEATRRLKDMEVYKQDSRYLKLWILYAGYVDKPSIIYSYLLANDIGTDNAQLYEEYALVLERDGRRREADETYNLGINRRVEGLDRLKRRYADFQRRMVAEPLPSAPSPPRPTGPPTVGKRKVLGERSSKSRPVAATPPTTDAPSRPNSRVQIFIDPTGQAGEKADGNQWPDLGTRASRTKENRPEVRKMGTASLKNVSGLPAPATRFTPFRDAPAHDGFVPFRDEDDTALMPPPSVPPKSTASLQTRTPACKMPPVTPKAAFLPFRDESSEPNPLRSPVAATPGPRVKSSALTSEAEALRKDPFKNYDLPS